MIKNLPILLVENDCDLRQALCDTLQPAGYETAGLPDAHSALDYLSRQAAGLVIADIRMTLRDGHSLLKAIRLRHPAVPVVLMTAFGDIEQAVSAMHAGARDYLLKPFEPHVLLSQVRRHISRTAERPRAVAAQAPSALSTDIKSLERAQILEMLAAVNGSRKQVVRQLGISERTLRYKLRQYRLEGASL